MNFVKGDKLRCISVDGSEQLKLGKIYTFSHYNDCENVCVEGSGNDGFYPYRFVKVEESLSGDVEMAISMLDKKITEKNGRTFTPNHIRIFTKPCDHSSPLVGDVLKIKPYCVALCDDWRVIPLSECNLTPESIEVEGVGDYTAKVYSDKVVVGCQEIPLEKVKEILEASDKLK
jgi:3-dehydroquinate synthase class II